MKYKYEDFEVEASSMEEAITKLVDIVIEWRFAEEEVFTHTNAIVHSWCICDYYIKFGDPSNLLEHEKRNLKLVMWDLSNLFYDFEEDIRKISEDKKRKLLNEMWWEDGADFKNKPDSATTKFMAYHEDFSISTDEKLYEECGRDFVKEVPKLIELIAVGNGSRIFNYIEEKFPKKQKV